MLDVFPPGGGKFDVKVAQSALTKEEWDNRPKLNDVRTIVRRETWHPVLRATPAKQIAVNK
jgi:hypothetical protein